MRMSTMFGLTLRRAPSNTEAAGHALLLRAAFVRQLASGIFSYLPLAKRTIDKIQGIMREEIDAIGGQEVNMPVVHPAEVWKESGRWYEVGAELGRFKDRSNRDLALAMTHEEIATDLARTEVRSYRQLPALVYHIQTKWRDDPRPRAGLIRAREFTMLDGYSLDRDQKGLDEQYRAHHQTYFRIFSRCVLPSIAVDADVGIMGGNMAHEFMYLTPLGEDTLIICDACGYTANRQIARFEKPRPEQEQTKTVEKIATPGADTIESLARLLQVPKGKTAKAIFMVATVREGSEEEERFVLAVVRGDMEVNETKLANAVKAKALRPAHEEEIQATGAVPGYGSPLGVEGALVVVDDAIPNSPNLVAGANEEGFHFMNVNHGRDFEAGIIADIASVQAGSACPSCKSPVRTERGVEIGNIFKFGTRYSEPLGASFLDRDGKQKPVIMGSYGIGVGRLLACIAEEHHDEDGLLWPISVAPYQVHLVSLKTLDDPATELYEKLEDEGIEVLYDDRDESLGVKFKDADLIGVPIRLTLTPRSLENGGVELKLRRGGGRSMVPLEEVITTVREKIAELEAEVRGTLRTESAGDGTFVGVEKQVRPSR